MGKALYLLIVLMIGAPTSYYFLYELPRHNKEIENISKGTIVSIHPDNSYLSASTSGTILTGGGMIPHESSKLIETEKVVKPIIKSQLNSNINSEKQTKKNQAKINRETCNQKAKDAFLLFQEKFAQDIEKLTAQVNMNNINIANQILEIKSKPYRKYDQDILICTDLYDKELQRINLEYN